MPSEQIVLGIDTSGLLGGVAIATGVRLLAETRLDARAAASEKIVPQIDRLLADLGLDKRALTRVGVALGPGSFTGLRVGIATAQGLAHGLGIPVVGLSSLRARSFQLAVSGTAILTVMAHRQGDVFVGGGIWEQGRFTERLAEASVPLEAAPTWVASARGDRRERLLCTGDAVPLLWATLAAAGAMDPELIAVPGRPGALPGAIALMAAAAPAEDACGQAALDELAPHYLRASDARPPTSTAGVGENRDEETQF